MQSSPATGETSNNTKAEPDVDRGSRAGPDLPTELTGGSWWYATRMCVRKFMRDQCMDLAAALTYYSVLAVFPAALAVLSLVSLVGSSDDTVRTLVTILEDMGASKAASTLEPTLTELAQSSHGGITLALSLLVALWSASGYVAAFGRGMNRIYGVEEGRPLWKLRAAMLVLTVVTLILTAFIALGLVLTGPVARSVGSAVGAGPEAVTAWGIAKWPVMLFFVILIVALLYHATPNVQQPKFHWISVGATVAIVSWIAASALFGLYVANFAHYNRTYGSLAGMVVFLLWLWITNLALLFGAELDTELERARQLQAGISAEESVQLPPRDTTKIEAAESEDREDRARGRELDESPDTRPRG